jgi:hypothetical protein
MKKLSLLLVSIVIVACATGYSRTYRIKQVQVVNLTGATIRDINVRVAGLPTALSCDEVANNAICNEWYSRNRYLQQEIELIWTHDDGSRKTASLNPQVPGYLNSVRPLRLVLEIRNDGPVNPIFEQDSRS